LEIIYHGLSEETKAIITFPQYATYRNPHWSEEDILHGIIIADKKKKEAARWCEEQRDPTPIRSTQTCHYYKGPWEPDHRCRGKDQKHTIEAHYDTDDEMCEDGAIDADLGQSDDDSDSCTEASDSDSCTEDDATSTLEEDDDSCVVDRQLDGQDDSTGISTDISYTIDDLILQQSGDISEDSHVFSPTGDQPPMGTVTHLSSIQTPMIATSHEEISGISGMMDEPSVRDAHHGQVDPQIQEEVQDVHAVDLIGQPEEIESQILETPLVEQVMETNRLVEHLLPGSTCSEEDALFIGQDDHSTCLDTSIWDPGADDSSRLSAQEDTTAHTGYNVIQGEIAPGEGVQWHTGVPNNTVDRGQSSTLSYAESVFGDSRVDISRTDSGSEGYEVSPQHDHDQESHHLATQLRVSEDMIMVATRRIDDMYTLMADCCWRASLAHDSLDEAFSVDEFQTLLEGMSVMRSDFQQWLTDRDYLLGIGETYHRALREQELEMDRLTQELESTRGFLRGTQTTLQESESRSEELLEEIRRRSTSPILVDTQMYHSVTLLEDVDDLAEEHQLMEDTSICVLRVVDLHIEVDPAVRPGSVMQHESTRDDMSMLEHTVMSDNSQRHAEMYDGIQRGVLTCGEETHLGEHADTTLRQKHMDMREHLHHISSCMRDDRWRLVDQQLEELLPVVLDGWDSMMTTGEYLSYILMDELLVESLGLTKACDAFQSYSQLQTCLLSFFDTFIIDRSMRRIADEHRGILTVISLTHEQLDESGSDKLPSFPWDLGVHWVSRMFHYMMTQVAPESYTLHQGSVWSGPAGICLIERGIFSLLIIMIGRGDGWIGTSFTEMSLQI
jgi:hypothetical protein